MSKKIELTDPQKEVLQRHLEGEFSPFMASDEEKKNMQEVIEKAEALLDELDAYDEMGIDLMEWFWRKYENQESQGQE